MNADVSFFTDTVPSRPHLNKFIAMADNGRRLQSLDSHHGRLQSLDSYHSHDQLEKDALSPGWKVSEDQNGNPYYYNKELKGTQWSRPEELKVTQWSRPGQSTLEHSLKPPVTVYTSPFDRFPERAHGRLEPPKGGGGQPLRPVKPQFKYPL